MVDDPIVLMQCSRWDSGEAKTITCHARPSPCVSCSSKVDERVANHESATRLDPCALHQREEPGRIGLAWQWPVAAKHAAFKVGGQTATLENCTRGAEGFIGQHGQRSTRGQRIEQFWDAFVGPREPEQPLVVGVQEALEQVGRFRAIRRGKSPGNEQRSAVAHHTGNRRIGQRCTAARFEDGVRRIRNVTLRVDQRAVQIEDKQGDRVGRQDRRYSAEDVGVSQTVTRATGKFWLAA